MFLKSEMLKYFLNYGNVQTYTTGGRIVCRTPVYPSPSFTKFHQFARLISCWQQP